MTNIYGVATVNYCVFLLKKRIISFTSLCTYDVFYIRRRDKYWGYLCIKNIKIGMTYIYGLATVNYCVYLLKKRSISFTSLCTYDVHHIRRRDKYWVCFCIKKFKIGMTNIYGLATVNYCVKKKYIFYFSMHVRGISHT